MQASRLCWFLYLVAAVGLSLWGLGLFNARVVADGAEVAGWVVTIASMVALAFIGLLTRRRSTS